MATVAVYNIEGKEVDKLELNQSLALWHPNRDVQWLTDICFLAHICHRRKYHLPRYTINCRLSDCLFQAFFRDTPDADFSI